MLEWIDYAIEKGKQMNRKAQSGESACPAAMDGGGQRIEAGTPKSRDVQPALLPCPICGTVPVVMYRAWEDKLTIYSSCSPACMSFKEEDRHGVGRYESIAELREKLIARLSRRARPST